MKSVMEASPIFFPGREVTFQTPERTLTLTIDRHFAPFTKAVVLLARSPELGPDPVVVKIYDPRFLDERLLDVPTCPARPWSLEAERAADAIWDAPYDPDAVWEDEPEDAEGRAVRAALWEKHYRRLSTNSFGYERDIYDRLRPLQGSAIPRLLATGIILPPDERAIQPPAVIIEYIPDAVSLCDIPVELVTPELCATLLRIVDSFGSYGVVHTDVHWNNVLFTPSMRPTRVVVIDFGCGGVRTEDEDEDDWKECVRFNDDNGHVRLMPTMSCYWTCTPRSPRFRYDCQEWDSTFCHSPYILRLAKIVHRLDQHWDFHLPYSHIVASRPEYHAMASNRPN